MTENATPGSINIAPIAPTIPSAASALIGDPSKFGRVGEDGTVYVITPQGEKAVGSYPGKTADEALQYFVRKFEALASEVALTAARITSGARLREYYTTLRCQHAPSHCRRSRGKKGLHFQSKKAGRVRAGPGPSKEMCN